MANFQTKNPSFWVNFWGSCNGRRWHIVWYIGVLNGHWYISWPVGIFWSHLSIFYQSCYVLPRQIWQPCWKAVLCRLRTIFHDCIWLLWIFECI
jgi:hypothetical protein